MENMLASQFEQNSRFQILDSKDILENPNKIISDTVRLACDKLWITIKEKVIFKYNLISG